MLPLSPRQDEEDYADGEQNEDGTAADQQADDEQAAAAAAAAESDATSTTTTTEPPKRVGPIIRPFRSNDDLLNALKRRQQNVKTVKKVVPAPKSGTDSAEQENESAGAAAPAHHSHGHKSSSEPGKSGLENTEQQ